MRGPSAADGYWNQREKSRRTFRGEWTHTGDTYVREADGSYRYRGRADDMMKVGGVWVSPFEVEAALIAHPSVLEAAVVGHLDGDGLTKPKAFVVLRDPGRIALGRAARVAQGACAGEDRGMEISSLDRGGRHPAQDRDRQNPALQASPAAGRVRSGGRMTAPMSRRAMSLSLDGRAIEAAWWGPGPEAAPTLVLLHEGLGCVALWRDVPARLARDTGCGVFAYSRFGLRRLGAHAPAPPARLHAPRADEVLARVLDAIGVRRAGAGGAFRRRLDCRDLRRQPPGFPRQRHSPAGAAFLCRTNGRGGDRRDEKRI